MARISILGRKQKQPGDTADFYVDFSEWFDGSTPPRTDGPLAYTVTVETGLTKVYDALNDKVVKVVVSGGTAGKTYKVTVILTTSAAPEIVKEAEFTVTVLAV